MMPVASSMYFFASVKSPRSMAILALDTLGACAKTEMDKTRAPKNAVVFIESIIEYKDNARPFGPGVESTFR
ncbi:MAG: hypothetical protein EBZ31_01950 [Flavobacteriia bacterium]|nr:hypothetical protein [Flavobacteriia bacterium]